MVNIMKLWSKRKIIYHNLGREYKIFTWISQIFDVSEQFFQTR